MARHKNLGNLEQQVMDFLWKNGPATGDAVRAAVGKDRPLTDSTIRTVLRRLEAKGYVRHKLEGRQFIYSSSREPRKVAAEMVRGVIKKFCRGSLEELLTGRVDHRVIDSADGKTTSVRLRLEQHVGARPCETCHVIMDPPGYALENFNAIGQWQDSEGAIPVDASIHNQEGRGLE